jgi:hypothetical protein
MLRGPGWPLLVARAWSGVAAGSFLSLSSGAVAAVATLALLPSALFDALGRRAFAVHRGGLRIYYDRDCGFCRKICLIFRTFFLLGDTPVRPAQDDPDVHDIMRRHDSWVVFDYDDTHAVRWHAVLLLLRRSLLFRPLGRLLTAVGMGRWCDWLYAAIGASRGFWSRITARLLPYRHVDVAPRRAAMALLGIWLAAVLLMNLWPGTLPDPAAPVWSILVDGLALDQRWCWFGCG